VTNFNELGLAAPLIKALAAKNYSTPTPIQAQVIPAILAKRDLVGLAQTGTGKTAAFALPILQRLSETPAPESRLRGSCRTLVLAPTRELAAQIGESFRSYGRFMAFDTAVVFGGQPIVRQVKALARGVDVLVATPGRLLDLIEQRACRLDAVEILVLDEADHMFDMGFIAPLRKIVRMTPKQRQTLLFSATMPEPIALLANDFLNEPVRVAVAAQSATADRVSQSVIHVDAAKKQSLLNDLLKSDPSISRAIVFTRTKHGANRVVAKLDEARIAAEAIHGNKSQGQRERALANFKSGQARLLIATEIAARGIDIHDVTHVINFDLPDLPEQYVHRIGRTARAGAEGIAISFCAPDERGSLRDIERLTRQAVPVLEHALSIAPPQPGERVKPRTRPNQQQHRRPGAGAKPGMGKHRPRPKAANGANSGGGRPGGAPSTGAKRPFKPNRSQSANGAR
jgi:ATP-dependent RNA helicase RhlE